MCLYIKKVDQPEIADKDIVCYKAIQILDKDSNEQAEFCSPFYRSPVVLGSRYDSRISRRNTFYHRFVDTVEEAIHSCISTKEAINIATTGELRTGNKYAVVKCIIPKGTTYYKGYFSIDLYATSYISNLQYDDELIINSYASESIIYTDELIALT